MAPAPRREDTAGHRARGRARATWSDVPVASTEVRERGQVPCSLFMDRTHESQTHRTAVVRTELSHVGRTQQTLALRKYSRTHRRGNCSLSFGEPL